MAYDTWNSNVYEAMLNTLVQERGPKLMDTVMVSYGFDQGEYKFVNQVGSVDLEEVTSRLQRTQWDEMDRYRRRISKQNFQKSLLFDTFEELDVNVDPTSKTTEQLLMGFGRKVDSVIIAAADGTAYTGKSGGTSTTLPSGQKVLAQSAGLTKAKLIETLEVFNTNNVDGDYDPITFVIGPKQLSDLLAIDEIASADYNVVKVLTSGKVASFMGFNFIMSNQLTTDGSDDRLCLAYAKSGIELAVAKGFTLTADRLPDWNNAVGFTAQCSMGAARLEEEKVVQIACVES